MDICPTREDELDCVMDIYARARRFMATQGNPRQWGESWPPRELVASDIAQGLSFVCVEDGVPVGVFYFAVGEDPTYRCIENGSWASESPYGVIHRIASSGTVHGIGRAAISWALERCGHLRIDTHPDNVPMQRLLEKLGFEKRGVIHVEEDEDPRFAYELCVA